MHSKGFGWIDGKYIKPPDEYKMREEELSCISMINSILAYNWSKESAEEIMRMEERNYYNYLAQYVELFGRDKIVALIQKQMNSIQSVKRNVHTDNDGVTYNSIIWRDENEM